jgi:hypothetical protein
MSSAIRASCSPRVRFVITATTRRSTRTSPHAGTGALPRPDFTVLLLLSLSVLIASTRVTEPLAPSVTPGPSGFAVYPLDKFNRVEFSAGYVAGEVGLSRIPSRAAAGHPRPGGPPRPAAGSGLRAAAPCRSPSGTRERRRASASSVRSSGSTINLSLELSPEAWFLRSLGNTVEFDARKYMRVGGTSMLLATRVRGFVLNSGDQPRLFGFGGNMETAWLQLPVLRRIEGRIRERGAPASP